jgi:hypothetical protein
MKVVYTLPVRFGLAVPVAIGIPGLTIGKLTVGWKTDSEGNLEAVVVEFDGVDLSYTPEGRIDPAPAQLQEQAYRIANYIASRIYIQTSFDAIDPQHVLFEAPKVFPENPDEEAEFKRTPRRMWTSVNLDYSIRGILDPARYDLGFDHSSAHGYYADALRAASIFQKFELLYKVVEYFFSEEGSALDKAVSAYVAAYDSSFTPEVIRDLRFLRNRSVHPRARKGHVSPENIASVREVRASMRSVDKLAVLLLEHPTF